MSGTYQRGLNLNRDAHSKNVLYSADENTYQAIKNLKTSKNLKTRTNDLERMSVRTMVANSNHQILLTDEYVECNGTFIVYMPDVALVTHHYRITNIGTGVITLDGVDGTINGYENVDLDTNTLLILVSNGTNWRIS